MYPTIFFSSSWDKAAVFSAIRTVVENLRPVVEVATGENAAAFWAATAANAAAKSLIVGDVVIRNCGDDGGSQAERRTYELVLKCVC